VLRHYLVSVVLLIACAACAREPVRADAVKRLSVEARSACVAQGGKVELVLIGAESCVRPTTDGGRPCSDSAECQGACIAPFAAKPEDVVTGTCATEIGRVGCINIVAKGKASGEACFD
jgi:hypothetical protein